MFQIFVVPVEWSGVELDVMCVYPTAEAHPFVQLL